MATKMWIEKRDSPKEHKVKTIEKRFADIPAGAVMLVPTPLIVDEHVRHIPFGCTTDISTMRKDMANEYNADHTCPVTASIFLRIVSEAAFEEIEAGKAIDEVTPFWRIVNSKTKFASKLACGISFIEDLRAKEK